MRGQLGGSGGGGGGGAIPTDFLNTSETDKICLVHSVQKKIIMHENVLWFRINEI